MKNLFLIDKSPFKYSTYLSKLKLLKENDALLFLNDGVICIKKAPKEFEEELIRINKTYDIKMFAIKSDLDARGIEANNCEIIDYDKLVDLIFEFDRCI